MIKYICISQRIVFHNLRYLQLVMQPESSEKKINNKLFQSKIKATLFKDEDQPYELMAESPESQLSNNSSSNKHRQFNTSPKHSSQEKQLCSSPFPSLIPQWKQNIMESNEKSSNKIDGSPGLLIANSNSCSFRKIMEREDEYGDENDEQYLNQDLSENRLYDVEGNTICEFDLNSYDYEHIRNLENDFQVIEDKENDLPYLQTLQTPLKNKELRSPLRDITPSITKNKKKSSALRTVSSKNQSYLTPRTMAESRFAGSSSLRRIQRL